MKQAKIVRGCIYLINKKIDKWIIPLAGLNMGICFGHAILSMFMKLNLLLSFGFGIFVISILLLQIGLLIIGINKNEVLGWLYVKQILKENTKYAYFTSDGMHLTNTEPNTALVLASQIFNKTGVLGMCNLNEFILINKDIMFITGFTRFTKKLKKLVKSKKIYFKSENEFFNMVNSKVNTKTDLVLFALNR